MEVINKKYGFKFEVPDDFEQIPEKDYQKYNFDLASTVAVFVKFERGVPTSISINRDDTVDNEKDYLDLVSLNIRNMEAMEMVVDQHIHTVNKIGRVDTIYSKFKGLKFVTYFTVVHKIMIACSIEVKEINDENDNIVAKLFESIEEI